MGGLRLTRLSGSGPIHTLTVTRARIAGSPSNARIPVAALAGWQDDLDTVVSLVAPEAELRPLRSQPRRPTMWARRGRAVAEDLRRDWAELTFDPDETHEDGETVVVIGQLRARARDSGADLDTRGGLALGRPRRADHPGQAHSDPDEALRAAGLDRTTARATWRWSAATTTRSQ